MAKVGDRHPKTAAGAYWDTVLAGWESTVAHQLWRAHSDAVNIRLIHRWLPARGERLLKTDLFDEATGNGLYPELAGRAKEVIGIDLSAVTVGAARRRYPELDCRVADVRALPFADASFDAIVSNSTLDHFDSAATIRVAQLELARVLRPGGVLLITLDNRMNPVVALRTSRLYGPLHRLGVVPYYVGATLGPRGLKQLLSQTGFLIEAITSIMHCPPQIASALAARGRARRAGRQAVHRHLGAVLRFEAMERWPTRHLTGHFVAARAVRRS